MSRLTSHIDLCDFSLNKFKLYMFEGEHNIKRKIKLQLVE